MSVLSDEIRRLEQQRQELLDRAAAARSAAQQQLEQGGHVLTDQAKRELQERSERQAALYEGCADRVDEQVIALKSVEHALQREEELLQAGRSDPQALTREFEQLELSTREAAEWVATQREAIAQQGMALYQEAHKLPESEQALRKEVQAPASLSYLQAPASFDPVTAAAIGGAALLQAGEAAMSKAGDSLGATLDKLAHNAKELSGTVADLLNIRDGLGELSERRVNRALEEVAKQPETLENKVLALSAEHDRARAELADQSKALQQEEQTLQRQLELAEQGRENFVKRQEQLNVEPEKYQDQLATLNERVEQARQRLQEFREMSLNAREEYARQLEEMRQRHQRELDELQRK